MKYNSKGSTTQDASSLWAAINSEYSTTPSEATSSYSHICNWRQSMDGEKSI